MIDFCDQFLHAAKRSPAKSLLRNAIEPDFHLIEPRGIGWSEVHMESWSCGEPAFNAQMLVRGVITDLRGGRSAMVVPTATVILGPDLFGGQVVNAL